MNIDRVLIEKKKKEANIIVISGFNNLNLNRTFETIFSYDISANSDLLHLHHASLHVYLFV